MLPRCCLLVGALLLSAEGCVSLPEQRAIGELKARYKTSGDLQPFIDDLKHPDGKVRGRTAGALVGIGEPAMPALIQSLDWEEATQKEIAGVLGRMGKPAVKPGKRLESPR